MRASILGNRGEKNVSFRVLIYRYASRLSTRVIVVGRG